MRYRAKAIERPTSDDLAEWDNYLTNGLSTSAPRQDRLAEFVKVVATGITQKIRDSIDHLYLEDESPEHDDTGRKVVLMILADLDAVLKEK